MLKRSTKKYNYLYKFKYWTEHIAHNLMNVE